MAKIRAPAAGQSQQDIKAPARVSREERVAFFEHTLPDHLPRLGLRDLKKIITLTRKEMKVRYPRNHKSKKYGSSVNRGFTDEEHARFMQHVDHPKARLAFTLMYGLGLRIGEVPEIKLEDIDFLNRTIHINTEKSGTSDVLPLHDTVFYALRDWVNHHHAAIMNHGSYIFYSSNPAQKRQHISKDWLRKYFREVREAAGLNQVYAITNERFGRKPRRQFRLTTHSHRHSFGTRMYKFTRDPKIVQRALRHTDAKSTDTYIHVPADEVHEAIRRIHEQMMPSPPMPRQAVTYEAPLERVRAPAPTPPKEPFQVMPRAQEQPPLEEEPPLLVPERVRMPRAAPPELWRRRRNGQ